MNFDLSISSNIKIIHLKNSIIFLRIKNKLQKDDIKKLQKEINSFF